MSKNYRYPVGCSLGLFPFLFKYECINTFQLYMVDTYFYILINKLPGLFIMICPADCLSVCSYVYEPSSVVTGVISYLEEQRNSLIDLQERHGVKVWHTMLLFFLSVVCPIAVFSLLLMCLFLCI